MSRGPLSPRALLLPPMCVALAVVTSLPLQRVDGVSNGLESNCRFNARVPSSRVGWASSSSYERSLPPCTFYRGREEVARACGLPSSLLEVFQMPPSLPGLDLCVCPLVQSLVSLTTL